MKITRVSFSVTLNKNKIFNLKFLDELDAQKGKRSGGFVAIHIFIFIYILGNNNKDMYFTLRWLI